MTDLRKAHAEHGSTSLRLAAEMALEALESVYGKGKRCEAAIKELRQALAQQEQVLTARVVVAGIEHESWCDSVTKLLLSMPPQIPPCNCKLKNEQGNSRPNYPISESSTSLDKIVEIAIQGHASTRDAIRWAMQQEREACAKVCEDICLRYSKDDYAERVVSQWCAQAIRARSEKPPVKSYCGGKPNYCTPEVTPDVDAVNISAERVDETSKREHEPVAWMWKDGSLTSDPYEADGTWTKLYTTPPKREWVGLTEYQRLKFADRFHISSESIEAIEAKLKEKNGG